VTIARRRPGSNQAPHSGRDGSRRRRYSRAQACSSVRRRTRARFRHRSRRPGYWRRPSLTSSTRGISGWAARGGQTYDPCSSSRDAFLDRYAARDPGGNDQGAKQRRWSEVSTGSKDDLPGLIASQHGMCSPSSRTDLVREDDQRFRWPSAWWSPPPESNRRPHPYHG
jgi:hypothetical protein